MKPIFFIIALLSSGVELSKTSVRGCPSNKKKFCRGSPFNPNNRPNHGPIRGQNQQPQGQNQQPQRSGNNHQGQDLGPKSFGDQIEDKYIPTVVNPYPAPIPGFYDQMGIPCNPYITYQQPIIVG